MPFPPPLAYPYGIDSDRTLYHVKNTTEGRLASANPAYATEIDLVPAVGLDPWPESGFATIEGELFYFDAVERDGDGKAVRLTGCNRGMGRVKSKSNPAGTWVRGFVIAETHNRLVAATLALETVLFDLDERLERLEAEPVCEDDNSLCPDVTFDFEVTERLDRCRGIAANYRLSITGTYTSFRVDFGDGTSTTTEMTGTHVYAPNATIDPVVTVSNDRCQIVQTASDRDDPNEPEAPATTEPFRIPIPGVDLPDIVLSDLDPDIPELELPQFVGSCLGLEGNTIPISVNIGIDGVSIPDTISITPIEFPPITVDMPSLIEVSIPDFPGISIEAPDFPPITFDDPPTFPPITFDPPEFPPIVIDPPTFPPITITPPTFPPITVDFGDPPTFPPITFGAPPTIPPITFGAPPTLGPIEITAPTFPDITVNFGAPPAVTVNWGSPPAILAVFGPPPQLGPIAFGSPPDFPDIGFEDPPKIPDVKFAAPPKLGPVEFGAPPQIGPVEFGSPPSIPPVEFGEPPTVGVDWGSPPECACTVTVTCGGASMAMQNDPWEQAGMLPVDMSPVGIPTEIQVKAPDFRPIEVIHNIPEFIAVEGNIPDLIRLLGPERDLPSEIVIRSEVDIPSFISVVLEMPSSISLETNGIEHGIQLVAPSFPPLNFEGMPSEVRVVGFPDVLKVDMPTEIKAILELPENLTVPLVYSGPPIPVQWQTGPPEEGLGPCFSLVPCGR